MTTTTIDDEFCCALKAGHVGECAYRCSDCNGTGRCLPCFTDCFCDDVVQCSWCDGSEACPSCYEGFVGGDAS